MAKRSHLDDNGQSTPCVLWPWSRDEGGYGAVRCGGIFRAHRLIYSIFKGPIPDGMMVLHSCDNPPCVNPEHLRVGTALDNARDRVERGRGRKPTPRREVLADLSIGHVRLISEGMSAEEADIAFGITKALHADVCDRLKRYGGLFPAPGSQSWADSEPTWSKERA